MFGSLGGEDTGCGRDTSLLWGEWASTNGGCYDFRTRWIMQSAVHPRINWTRNLYRNLYRNKRRMWFIDCIWSTLSCLESLSRYKNASLGSWRSTAELLPLESGK